ncbi:MAG TPA: phosphatidylglycerophosphatase A, partial [Pyrinomonadaceae bacterium]
MTTTPGVRTEAQAPMWASLIATLFGIGRLRPGPGTWASAITVLMWAAVAHTLLPTATIAVAIALAVVIVVVGISSSTLVARASGSKDPQIVVIDEMAGQLIALIAVPLTWKTLLAGFILF